MITQLQQSSKNFFKVGFLCLNIIIGICEHSFAEEAVYYQRLVREAELRHNIPKGLLLSITKIESRMHPWTVNSSKGSIYAKSRQEAKNIINVLVAEGVTNIDIGIAQLNAKWHGKRFELVTDMLEPRANIEYAAELLASLFKQHKEWHIATRYYHSVNSVHHKKYFKRILVAWLDSNV